MGAGDVDVTVASTIFSVDTSLVVTHPTIEKPLIFFTNNLIGFGPFLSCILQMVTASGHEPYPLSKRKLIHRLTLPGSSIIYGFNLDDDQLDLSSKLKITALFKLMINLLLEIIEIEVVQERQA
ncbi:MAG: hypothetical protein Q9226_003779 [Calogaya cf. arnoldii]